jgi:integrase
MSTLYKPKIVSYRLPDGSYRDPDGQRVTRGTPGAVRHVAESPSWWGRYTDGAGQVHQVKLSRSKEIARRMLAKLAGDGQLASVGIEDRYAEHLARPLAEHLEDYGRYLAAKGDGGRHVRQMVHYCQVLLEAIDAERIGDVQPSAVLEFLHGLRVAGRPRVQLPDGQEQFTRKELVTLLGIHPGSVARIFRRGHLPASGNGKARRYSRAAVEALQERLCRGVGISTTNAYLTAIKGFLRWLGPARENRAPTDPLACLSRQNAAADLRVIRRALDPEHFAALLAAARAGRPLRGLTGAERAVLYLLAARTGLRASELASLSPASFDFAAPSVTVEAAYSKRRRRDVQPLRADVAELLAGHVHGRPRSAPLWPGSWAGDGAEILREDLAAAGIAYLDEAGRVYDFHALRHQFITDLAAAGVHPKDAQALARHSTITLTMDRYTHVRHANLQAALDKLPELPGDGQAEHPRKNA